MGSSKGLLAIVLLFYTASLAMAADCNFDTTNVISTADIMNLASDVGINNISPPLENPLGFTPTTTHGVTSGTAQFCIRNSFIARGTHITLSDIQFGANDIVSQCCSLGPFCQGGQFTITGDDGVTVVLNVQPSGDECIP